MAKLREEFRLEVEQLAGATFTNFEEKKEVVIRIKRLANMFQMKFLYDDLPVILQTTLGTSGNTGRIQVLQKRKLLYARTAFPPLTVVKVSQAEKTEKPS